MLRNFMQAISSLWKPAPVRRPSGSTVSSPDTSLESDTGAIEAQSTRPLPGNDLEERLAQSADEADSILAGSLELIGLDDVREALGENWGPVSQKVLEFAAEELQLCLDPDDIFRQHGDASFLIHFGNLDKLAGERQASRVALRIKARLVENFPRLADALSIKHFVAKVDSVSLRDGTGSLVDTLFERLVNLREEADRAAKLSRRSLIKDFQVVFSPTWHTRKQVTVLNRSILNSSYARTPLSKFQELVDPEELAATYAELDYLVLTRSVEALHRVLQASRSAMLLVPVDFRTLHSNETVAEYVRLLEAMPKPYKKFIALEICGIPLDYLPSRVSVITTLLGRYAKYVAVELSFGHAALGAVDQLGAWAISISLAGESGADRALEAKLRRFTALADAAGLSSIARDARSTGLALAAAKVGFTYIDGTSIHLPVKEPRPPLRLVPFPRVAHPSTRLPSRQGRAATSAGGPSAGGGNAPAG